MWRAVWKGVWCAVCGKVCGVWCAVCGVWKGVWCKNTEDITLIASYLWTRSLPQKQIELCDRRKTCGMVWPSVRLPDN